MKSFIYLLFFLLFLSYSNAITFKGSGTELDPYQITNINELQKVNSYCSNCYFILMNDIDASETKNWNIGDHDKDSTTPDEPMGFEPIDFRWNNFNGNGHIIRNLYINRPGYDYIGLFGDTWISNISKLGLENCEFTGSGDDLGSICGHCDGVNIEKCYSTGKIFTLDHFTSNDSLLDMQGSFCGFVQGRSNIQNSYSSCVIYNLEDTTISTAFFADANSSSFRNCYIYGVAKRTEKIALFTLILTEADYCFWDVETTGVPDINLYNSSHGLSTANMMKQSSYEGWDFKNVWCIDEGKDYPKLRAFNHCPPDDVPSPAIINEDIITVSPNPVTDILYISGLFNPRVYPGDVNVSKIKIYNLMGIKVYESSDDWQSSDDYKINVSGLPAGVYFIHIGNKVEKFVKM